MNKQDRKRVQEAFELIAALSETDGRDTFVMVVENVREIIDELARGERAKLESPHYSDRTRPMLDHAATTLEGLVTAYSDLLTDLDDPEPLDVPARLAQARTHIFDARTYIVEAQQL